MLNIVAYIQADVRYNPFLLKEINSIKVIEHTINNILSYDSVDKVIIGLYDCEENHELLYLKDLYDNLEIYMSLEENLSKRLIEILEPINCELIFRLTGDQYNIDMKSMNMIFQKMLIDGYEFFMPDFLNGSISDVVKKKAIMDNRNNIIKYDRYYKFFLENKKCFEILNFKYDYVLWRFFVQDEFQFHICKKVVDNKITIKDFKKNILSIMFRIIDKDSELYKNGWLRSLIDEEIINCRGEALPWFPYTAIDFIEERLNQNMIVFEYGSGNSTLWLANKVSKLYSIEHNFDWYKKISKLIPNNVEYKYIQLEYGEAYSSEVSKYCIKFDVIIIDGRDRVNCCRNAIGALKDDGIIIWDDTFRDYYAEGYNILKENGFKELKFRGVGPARLISNQTSIFYRQKNCFNI